MKSKMTFHEISIDMVALWLLLIKFADISVMSQAHSWCTCIIYDNRTFSLGESMYPLGYTTSLHLFSADKHTWFSILNTLLCSSLCLSILIKRQMKLAHTYNYWWGILLFLANGPLLDYLPQKVYMSHVKCMQIKLVVDMHDQRFLFTY